MPSPYALPADETGLTGACAVEGGFCVWAGTAAYRWGAGEPAWAALSAAPARIDSGFEVASGVLVGADTHIGFLPSGEREWAWWENLASFSDAHPLYGDLLLCTDASTDRYTLFSLSATGLERLSSFRAEDRAKPVAGWSAPTARERLLLLSDGGLLALDPPYGPDALQHLVSFDDVDVPALDEIHGSFYPGVATVVIPRRTRTALRLDLTDGTGRPTGLAALPGGDALWAAYLEDDRDRASRLLSTLASLPAAMEGRPHRLYALCTNEDGVWAVATSAGTLRPSPDPPSTVPVDSLATTPFDEASLLTWALWLDWEGAVERACRRLCAGGDAEWVLVESLRRFVGGAAVQTLFDCLRESEGGQSGTASGVSPAALRALVATVGDEGASLVAEGLSAPSRSVRWAACAAAGATRDDLTLDGNESSEGTASSASVLWTDPPSVPREALLENAIHDDPAIRAAARDTCARLAIEGAPPPEES